MFPTYEREDCIYVITLSDPAIGYWVRLRLRLKQ